MEEIDLTIYMVKQEMEAGMKHLDHALQKIHAERDSTTMVQDVMVEYYGATDVYKRQSYRKLILVIHLRFPPTSIKSSVIPNIFKLEELW